jgi:hypothetical protein
VHIGPVVSYLTVAATSLAEMDKRGKDIVSGSEINTADSWEKLVGVLTEFLSSYRVYTGAYQECPDKSQMTKCVSEIIGWLDDFVMTFVKIDK